MSVSSRPIVTDQSIPASRVEAGPKPVPGLDRRSARRAFLKVRLTAPGDAAGSATAGQDAIEAALFHFQPTNEWHRWIVGQIATLQVRISHIQQVERRQRDWASYRAIDFWEEDQRLAVEVLAAKLPRNPAPTVARLRQTPAGCDWLIARWEALRRLDPAAWTEDQSRLAAHLLGQVFEPGLAPTLVPADQIAALQRHRPRVDEADALTRAAVEADLSDDLGPDFARLRRAERSLLDRLRFFLLQLQIDLPDRPAQPRPEPTHLPPAPAPPPIDATKPTPPDETKPLDPNEKPTLPDETKPLAHPEVAATEPDHQTHRRRRIDLQQTRKRQRRARRRQG